MSIERGQGRRVMEPRGPIQRSHPLSRYGDWIAPVLPSVFPAAPCKRRVGFTDLSRLCERDHSRSGQLLMLLPDKELRYLRTVIVTAAVYWGFGRELRSCELTLFLNLPTPGRRQTLYLLLRVRRVLCF